MRGNEGGGRYSRGECEGMAALARRGKGYMHGVWGGDDHI